MPATTTDHRRPDAAPGGGPASVPAAERGETRLADRVVARIAAQSAREALHSLPADAVPPYANVTLHQDAGTARVNINLELAYPSDIGAQCRAVRRRVSERVAELAGLKVLEVVVHVERLHSVRGELR
ncbi:Asp23/Gls24 family envelope stress response protein [Streptomyces abyssomicinicus]|uniref:Asp23/Gls24 family envelope stress response protein n=1 Tax=Streptomyces abyssomicinicus TaxID=574929 RepID=UPI003F7776A2